MSKLPRHQLAVLLAEKTFDTPLDTLADQIAAYLLGEHRTGELDSLMRDIQQYRADHGIVEAITVDAHALSARVRKDVEAKLYDLYPAAKKVIISEIQDPDLIGGARIELANQQLDISIRSKLNRFKQLTAVGE